MKSRVWRGLLLSCSAMASRPAWVWRAKLVRFGRYWRRSPLVFRSSRAARGSSGRRCRSARRSRRELGVQGHLFAVVPGDRVAHLLGQLQDPAAEGGDDLVRGAPVGQRHEHHVAARPFDEGGHCGVAGADHQVAFPMAGHGPIGDLGGSFAAVDDVGELASACTPNAVTGQPRTSRSQHARRVGCVVPATS